jgi:hypothetical protein
MIAVRKIFMLQLCRNLTKMWQKTRLYGWNGVFLNQFFNKKMASDSIAMFQCDYFSDPAENIVASLGIKFQIIITITMNYKRIVITSSSCFFFILFMLFNPIISSETFPTEQKFWNFSAKLEIRKRDTWGLTIAFSLSWSRTGTFFRRGASGAIWRDQC